MSAKMLRDFAVDSIVTIYEDGKPFDYYIKKHNYESGLNGEGRTLLVRADSCEPRKWNNKSGTTGNADDIRLYSDFATSSICEWLNSTFYNSLEESLRSAINQTTFVYTTNGKDDTISTLSRAIFLLSLTELGGKTASQNEWNDEGSKLPTVDNLYERDEEGVEQWTRTPKYSVTISAMTLRRESGTLYSSTELVTKSKVFRPAFTVPDTLYVLDNGVLTVNVPPQISGDIASGSSIGVQNQGISISYSVSDVEGDAVTVNEYLDERLWNTKSVILGQENAVEIQESEYQKILNGDHVLSVIANDGIADSEPYEIRFTKKVTSASVTLKHPLDADDAIQVAVMSIAGSIPEDASLQVLLTNNANDEQPVWEDATGAVRAGENYVFANQTAENGFAFNFMICVSRGESDVGGYISNIGGAFQ